MYHQVAYLEEKINVEDLTLNGENSKFIKLSDNQSTEIRSNKNRMYDIVKTILIQFRFHKLLKNLWKIPGYPYCLVDQVKISLNGNYLVKLTGKQLFLLHNIDKFADEYKSYAKHGLIYIDAIDHFHLPCLAFSQITTLVTINTNAFMNYFHILRKEICELFSNITQIDSFDVLNEVSSFTDITDGFEVSLRYKEIMIGNPGNRMPNNGNIDQLVEMHKFVEYPANINEIELPQFGQNNGILQIFFVVENPDKPFEFYSDAFKNCNLRISHLERFSHPLTPLDLLAFDKVKFKHKVPDIPIYTITFETLQNLMVQCGLHIDHQLDQQHHKYLRGTSSLLSIKNFKNLDDRQVAHLVFRFLKSKNIPPNARVTVCCREINVFHCEGGCSILRYVE